MSKALLFDIGSTFTKVTAVDTAGCRIIGTAKSPTTTSTDITEGMNRALAKLGANLDDFDIRLACSSAAGGLEVAAIGLHPKLTVEAARKAALGAGAKVTNVYERKLSPGDVAKIDRDNPDIILLSGGTDGGNTQVIIHNARALLNLQKDIPVIVAGNAMVSGQVQQILERRFSTVKVTENVLPDLHVLNVEPCRRCIRELFMQNIVRAKGWQKAETLVDRVLMPTPAAVLSAARLLADGPGGWGEGPPPDRGNRGLGELIVIDVGGATTDVHSIARGDPASGDVIYKGLPEPYAKRTVEGDLGVRFGVRSILADPNGQKIFRSNLPGNLKDDEIESYLQRVLANPHSLPSTPDEKMIDTTLARAAVELAVDRHAGYRKTLYSHTGKTILQYGKDLTRVRYVIGTGGSVVNSPSPGIILKGTTSSDSKPGLLKPVSPAFFIDHHYIMAAMGLLAQVDAMAAFSILTENLKPVPAG